MSTLKPIPAEHRRVYLDALVAARKTSEERGYPFEDAMALADMYRVIYHGSIKPLMAQCAELTEELERQRDDIDRAREVMDSDAYRLATGETCMPGQTASCGDFHNGGHCVRPRAEDAQT